MASQGSAMPNLAKFSSEDAGEDCLPREKETGPSGYFKAGQMLPMNQSKLKKEGVPGKEENTII